MPINPNNSIKTLVLHAATNNKGYHPYLVVIKNGGIYLEGAAGPVIHLSLHNRPIQNEPTRAKCHFSIPNEIEENIERVGFTGRKYFEWKRNLGLDNQFHCAALLIFPSLYATKRFAKIETQYELRKIIITGKAARVGFWYTGATPQLLTKYLNGFGAAMYVKKMPNGETFGINVSQEYHQEYKHFDQSDNFGTYNISHPNDSGQPTYQLNIGPYGQYCYGVVHSG